MNELFEEKMKVVLNLIRVNNSADEALKITQAVDNLVRARNLYLSGIELSTPVPQSQEPEPKTTKK